MMHKKISLFALVLLVVSSIDSIRNFPAAALFGSSLLFFFFFSAIVFLIPTSLVAADLSTSVEGKGGVYQWIRAAFGEKAAVLAIWLQWINTMVWYPTILSFIAGTAAYLIDPALAENKAYLVTIILSVFWGLTFVNLKGIHFSAKVNTICTLIGTLFPMALLIVLGVSWILNKEPVHIEFSARSIFPTLGTATNWISLTAIMASFLGMELSGVHVNDIDNPRKNFPKALLISVIVIVISQLLGSLTIAAVLPQKEIHLVDGIMQVFSDFFRVFHIEFLTPVLTLLIVVGSVGLIINWLIAPAKGLLHAAEFGYLPPFFSKLNKHGAASRILIAQAILVSFFCLAFLLIPSVNGFYWFLTDLSTELYMFMYVIMFFAALHLRKKLPAKRDAFRIPGGKWGMRTVCSLGLIGCFITLVVGYFPPDGIDVGTPLRYASMIFFGNILMIAPVLLFYWYKNSKRVR